jgi:hypothetical protein
MAFDAFSELRREVADANARLIEAVSGLDEAQLHRRPGGTLPSIAFHLWHTARWADYDAHEGVPERQLWSTAGYAERWRLERLERSDAETGTGLVDDDAAALNLPAKSELLAYASAALGSFEAWLVASAGDGAAVRAALVQHSHVNRHLGMVEAIKGLQGLRGTATR